jgi:hypothetical protein
MIRETLFCLFAAGAVAPAGCGHAPPVIRSEPRVGPLVGRAELLSTGQPWLFEALRIARPGYFIGRGPTTITGRSLPPMIVVIEGLVLPDLEPLRTTPVSEVVQVRRLSVAETYMKYSRSVSVGALEIVLRR